MVLMSQSAKVREWRVLFLFSPSAMKLAPCSPIIQLNFITWIPKNTSHMPLFDSKGFLFWEKLSIDSMDSVGSAFILHPTDGFWAPSQSPVGQLAFQPPLPLLQAKQSWTYELLCLLRDSWVESSVLMAESLNGNTESNIFSWNCLLTLHWHTSVITFPKYTEVLGETMFDENFNLVKYPWLQLQSL